MRSRTECNAIVDYTQTRCFPTGGKAGAFSFIVVSSAPVFSVEASKKAWQLVVVAAVGKLLNDRPTYKMDELIVSDTNLMKDRVGYALPASLAKSLQSRMFNGRTNLDAAYAEIQKSLVQFPKKQ